MIMMSPPWVVAIVRRPSPAVVPPPRAPCKTEAQPYCPRGRVPRIIVNVVEIYIIGTAHVNAGTRAVEAHDARGAIAVGRIVHRKFFFASVDRVCLLGSQGIRAAVVFIDIAQFEIAFFPQRLTFKRVRKVADASPNAFRIGVVVGSDLGSLAFLFGRNEIYIIVLCAACH